MFRFDAAKAVDFLPPEDNRVWLLEAMRNLIGRLGEAAEPRPAVLDASLGKPGDIDSLFDFICGVQAEVGQREVMFTLYELENDPKVEPGFVPLGDPQGQMMHTFVRDGEFLMVVMPQIFRVAELLKASVARELGRIAVHIAGGHQIEPEEIEADAELAAVVLGMGTWVANGAYIYENACCGGGCGIDLSSIRAGLSMPEACFAVAADAQRRGLSRRAIARQLAATQRAAFKASWSSIAKQRSFLALDPALSLPES